MSTASAPGKIILFGEHAVVYKRPALAVPVFQVHADVEISDSSIPGIWVDAPDISLHATLSALPPTDALRTVIDGFFQAQNIFVPPFINIRITSSIPVASGLGSGAAVSVALIRALSAAIHKPMPDADVNNLAYEIEKLYHGTPSGIDNTVITYARPVYFVRDQPIETFSVGQPFTLVIGNTGIPAPTKESVGDVRKLWLTDAPYWEKVFDQVGEIVQQARTAIHDGDITALGPLMNENHRLLQQLTVSSSALDNLVDAARTAGAIGAKLSGSGRGGNMIALVLSSNAKTVATAIKSAGALSTITTTVQ